LTDRYAFDPDAWTPRIAGLVAGAIGAIVAAIVGWTLTEFVFDQPHTYTNTLTVTIVAVVLGLVSGGLWGSLRASANGHRAFVWSMVGGFVVTIIAVLVADQNILNGLAPYAVPLTAIIFITLAFFTPLLSQVRTSPWVAAIPVLLAVGLGVGLSV
jgi:high-affinity Fe2+/Pb2+ permease